MEENKALKMFLEKDIRNNTENTPLNKIYSELLKDKDTVCRLWSDTKPLFEQIKDKLQVIGQIVIIQLSVDIKNTPLNE